MDGHIEEVEGTLQITRIEVHYDIRIPHGKREDADRALDLHVSRCPVAQTLTPCVEIEWTADIAEEV